MKPNTARVIATRPDISVIVAWASKHTGNHSAQTAVEFIATAVRNGQLQLKGDCENAKREVV